MKLFYGLEYFDRCKDKKDSDTIKDNPAIMYEMAGLMYETPFYLRASFRIPK